MRPLLSNFLEGYMDNIEQRVKKIVAEQLGVAEADIKNESSFVNDRAPTRSTRLNS